MTTTREIAHEYLRANCLGDIPGRVIERHTESCDALTELLTSVLASETARCAKVADAHKGSAAEKRRAKGMIFRDLSDDAVAEITAEERGEDIAAEMIAAAIRVKP